jgi:predicted nuclease with TOPRIM domain
MTPSNEVTVTIDVKNFDAVKEHIASLEAENARLREELSVWREDYALLQEENKRLREVS